MPTANQSFITRPISDAQLHDVYASDQEMYPAPLTFDRLQSWAQAAPDFSISFYPLKDDASRAADNNVTPVGIIIVLPLLRPHWENLLVGKVKEITIEAGTMFPSTSRPPATFDVQEHDDGGEEVEVGLHVFHVEKFKSVTPSASKTTSGGSRSERKGFAELAVEEALERARITTLTATEAGKRSFVRMGYTPTGYKEIFVTTGQVDGGDEVTRMIYEYPVTANAPHEGPGVSDLGHGAVVSEPSEMVVKYL
ncbi:hypothetical protein QBC37DRAFT_453378 [Rhypophila decipiens]|uniref:Uncharacterized protein n=1 Tax=Rhypophila decipiens TaxID=261697 RepID=A0AAN6Y2S4_9PEZI|nr:hypothetical protein QBC37DRAFT_453378 [Rhypophila decipiens]